MEILEIPKLKKYCTNKYENALFYQPRYNKGADFFLTQMELPQPQILYVF